MAILINGEKKLTYDDYLRFPDDDFCRHEVVGGVHEVTPSPVPYHQDISRRTHYQLYTQIELKGKGRVYYAPCTVRLSDIDVVEPDIFVVLTANAIVKEKYILGAPDLGIEIISPGSKRLDRGKKKDRYYDGGVPEYWIFDPETKSVERYLPGKDSYELEGVYTDRIEFGGLPGVFVDLTKVW